MSMTARAENPKYEKWCKRLNEERKTVRVAKGKSALKTDAKTVATASERRELREPTLEEFAGRVSSYGVAMEFYRMGRRYVSPGLQARADALGLRFEHLAVTIGTVIHNIDLSQDLSQEVIDVLRAVWLERKVIFFRGQNLTADQQVALGRRFGALDAFPFGDHQPGQNKVLRLSGIGVNAANALHTDVTWMEEPSDGSMIYMDEVPDIGGDTRFSDSHAAYWGLHPSVREKLHGTYGINDYRRFYSELVAEGVSEDTLRDLKEDLPFGVEHPLIRTHPETGKQALYFNAGFLRHESLHKGDEYWDPKESTKMVQHLVRQHDFAEYQCRFKYEKGSIAFWDNRSCQHAACGDWYPKPRHGRRITLRGERPFFNADATPTSIPVSRM